MTNTQKPLHKCNNCGQKFDKGEDTDGSCPNCGSPSYTNQEPQKPLWKVLNEQRTGGIWEAHNLSIFSAHFVSSFEPKNMGGSEYEKATASTRYTALAVNNFANVVGALEALTAWTIENTSQIPPSLIKAKTALKSIS